MSTFGEQLRRYRLRAGLSQGQLARRSGLTAEAIGALERGLRRRPYPDTVRRLAAALALTPAEQSALTATVSGTAGAPRSNVPAARDALIGREREVAALRDLLLGPGPPLVTLTGVGGGGKTRVAQAVAAEAADALAGGACWVALAPVTDPPLVPQAVAQALGVIEAPDRPLIDSLIARLSIDAPLLIIDNCEHLVDACARLVEDLLASCPGLRILATSREPFGVTGEQQWRVNPLSVPNPDLPTSVEDLERSPAARLFVDRARAAAPHVRLAPDNAAAIAAICARLEGIPLALELAAARTRVLSPAQILARLDDVFRLLTGGSRAAPTRQQTLRAALDWSYDLLTEDERGLFHVLAVFVGAFDLEAVEAVWDERERGAGSGEPGSALASPELWNPAPRSPLPAPSSDALDLLTSLVDKSLVQVEPTDGALRYRLLEPVRQYAHALLSACGDLDAAQTRHAEYYLAFAGRASPELRGPDQVTWFARLDGDIDNLRAALRWAERRDDAERLARLAVALLLFWEVRGYMSEGRRWLELALRPAHPQPLSDALRLRALLSDGRLAFWQAEVEQAADRFEASLTLARSLGDREAAAESLTWRGAVYGRQNVLGEAMALLEEGFLLHEALGDAHGAAWALFSRAVAAGNAEDWPTANALVRECLERYRRLGDVRFTAIASLASGAAMTTTESAGQANPLLEEGLAGLRAVGDRSFMLSGLLTLAWIQARLGDPRTAARLLGAAEMLRMVTGAAMAPVNHRTHDLTLRSIEERLSPDEIAAALSAGRTLTLDQAIEAATTLGRSAPTPAATAPDAGQGEALTRRERDLVPLLARGATDREIAADLGIAVSTVGVHVHHILGKLGLASRRQVADWAAAHGLAPAQSD